MKERVISALFLTVFAFNVVSCGSTTASTDTTPREAKVIALTGTLMAFIANTSAKSVVYDLMGDAESGTISTPVEKTYSELGMEGTSDDTVTVDEGSWSRTTAGGVITLNLTDLIYTSRMVEYPWNNTTPFAGAVISFDGIDFTVAVSTDDVLNINGSLTAMTKGTGSLADLTPTEYSITSNDIDIGTMTVNILDPSEKTGSVSFSGSPAFGGSLYNGKVTSSAILTSTVVYEGTTYSCSIIAGYTPDTMPGNTGLGELTVTSATCTE